MKHIGLAVALIGTGACAVPAELSSVEQDNRTCAPAYCGLNSPMIDYNGFHELEKRGAENDEGFAITRFEKGGVDYTLDVTGNALSGRRRGSQIAHGTLPGAQIHISIHGRDEWLIRVASVGVMPLFVGPPGDVETYVLEYGHAVDGDPPTTWSNLCGGLWFPGEEEVVNGPHDTHQTINTETLGQGIGDSILFDLDRIDMSPKTLNDRPDPSWFNIGCAGHTLSKLFLTRNMIASQGAAAAGLHDERQATLKLLTGDYFGDGTSFTVAGQRLDWQGGGMIYFSAPTALEARWDANGATCLSMPRMTQPSTAEGAAQFPDIEAAIAKHEHDTGRSRPRRCRPTDPNAITGALRTSALR